ncbi:abortive infection system antitoxin AbiGi family protein [Aliivibrio wodanis]|uniref:abortive infection system antitoxin AbiGi family protein n=1 Tax=Aliivibrio wodanis TaxID=80852 RepID=UPI00406C864A
MSPKSHTLFHFTQSRETLKLIFKNGFWPRYCLEDVRWFGFKSFDYIAYPMVCFCDIPLSKIDDHVNFYGEFGIGLTREWAIKNGLNPILYVAGDNHITQSFRELNDHANKSEGEQQTRAKVTMRYLLAHTKPTEGQMVMNNKPVDKLFYQESEWRFVPKDSEAPEYLVKSNYEDEAVFNEANELTLKNCALTISPQDVKYIFVKSDTDIPDMINFIQTDLDGFANSDIKVLMSRVVSLESIRQDI